MNVNQAVAAVVAAYETKQPIMLWGAPGVGKSSAAKQARDILAKAYKDQKFGLIDLRLSMMEPPDLLGLPNINKAGETIWSRPSFLPTSGRGIILLDEFVQAVPSMQNAASQLLLDRRIGDYILPDGWLVIAAGNRMSDRAATNSMPTHIANRFSGHLNVEVSLDAWVMWALQNGIDIRLVAFMKWRPALLHVFDPQAKALAFPSPRTWEFTSKHVQNKSLPPALLPDMVKGTVGDGAAADFLGFLRVFDQMPSIDGIRLNPTTAPIPSDPATLYAVVTALANGASVDNIGAIATYFNRISDQGRPEYSMAAMAEITAGDEDRPAKQKVANTRAYIEWSAKHAALMS